MSKKMTRLAALLLSLAFLAGCSIRMANHGGNSSSFGGRPIPDAKIPSSTPYLPSPVPSAPRRTQYQELYGSAGLLAFPTVLVSVYLNENGASTWNQDMIEKSRQNLAVAVQWITGQAGKYSASPKIFYDDGTPDNGLCYTYNLNTVFLGEETNETDEYYSQMEALCERLDTAELHSRYGTSSVGFLIFLPVSGASFTMVHYAEEEGSLYHEYCTLYAYDSYSSEGTFEGPGVYAHEILHLYGAPDLYDGSTDYYVTDELLRYIQEQWPTTIMYDTYDAYGNINYDAIDQILDPVTAYRLGLTDTFPGMDRFPDAALVPPGAFSDVQDSSLQELTPGIAA